MSFDWKPFEALVRRTVSIVLGQDGNINLIEVGDINMIISTVSILHVLCCCYAKNTSSTQKKTVSLSSTDNWWLPLSTCLQSASISWCFHLKKNRIHFSAMCVMTGVGPTYGTWLILALLLSLGTWLSRVGRPGHQTARSFLSLSLSLFIYLCRYPPISLSFSGCHRLGLSRKAGSFVSLSVTPTLVNYWCRIVSSLAPSRHVLKSTSLWSHSVR